ncbi:hypothetical protein [Labrys neptuniae]
MDKQPGETNPARAGEAASLADNPAGASAAIATETTGGQKEPPKPDKEKLKARRAVLTEAGFVLDESVVPSGSMGLALSGGGIRSATLSLGLVQAFARHKRLLDFDYLSTVSGGGYFGSFLTSLFLPDDMRGRSSGDVLPAVPPSAPTSVKFAEDVLSLDARTEQIKDPFLDTPADATMRNPIWWLREHSRYLAPNGPTDYGFAVSYIARNWISLIYTFFVVAAAAAVIILAGEWVVLWGAKFIPATRPAWHAFFDWLHDPLNSAAQAGATPAADACRKVSACAVDAVSTPSPWKLVLSPLFVVPPIFLAFGVATGIAYWLTVSLRVGNIWGTSAAAQNPADSDSQSQDKSAFGAFKSQARHVFWLTLAFGLVTVVAHVMTVPNASPGFWHRHWPWWAVELCIVLSLLGLAIGWIKGRQTAGIASGDAFTNEVRRRLTVLGARFNVGLATTLAIALIDTAALTLVASSGFGIGNSGFSLFAVIPALAWLIGNLPKWLGGGWIEKFLGAHIWTVALIVGAFMFGLVALLADIGVHLIAWNFHCESVEACKAVGPWAADADYLGLALWAFPTLAIMVLLLCGLTGYFGGFINLSSLHSLYAGRLTRAYLGASNITRLRDAVRPGGGPITENHPKDYIDISRYYEKPTPAPLHLINVTLNETCNPRGSQLVDRDRKGIPVVFAPEGIYVDAGSQPPGSALPLSWQRAKEDNVESLSVGQLCAISGAAASSGMGSRTTLGGALSLTFANIRLGYWWEIKRLLGLPEQAPTSGWRKIIAPFWRTYYYLWSEMTAQYTRSSHRVYLSDGGHFENSGAYELLRRRVRLAVVSDNGEDPNYEFEDLENLTRKARIDLGLSVIVAPSRSVSSLFGQDAAALFLNGGDADWRAQAKSQDNPAFMLLLDIYEQDEQFQQKHNRIGRIIWLKPRLFPALPPDIEGYAERNKPFPQQTTADQFFDEAQWESYRALGYAMGTLLLSATPAGEDVLRKALSRS